MMTRTERPPGQYGDLLFSIVVLLALAIAGLVVLALSQTTWSLALALVAAAAATLGVGLAARGLLADAEGASARRGARTSALVLGAVALATLVAAVAVPGENASTRRPQASGTTGAAGAVRDFLTIAAIEHSPYAACEYLTQAEQERIGRLAGPGAVCSEALTRTPPVLPGVTSEGGLRRLRVVATASGAGARVTVSGPGIRRLTFGLRRTTAAELDAFGAPAAAWRIAAGAAAFIRPAVRTPRHAATRSR